MFYGVILSIIFNLVNNLLDKQTLQILITGIIGIMGTLVGVYINSVTTEKVESQRRKSEEQRWNIDHYLERKINSISSLYLALLDWYMSVNRYSGYLPSCIGEYDDKLYSKEQAYWYCLIHASIYLKKNEYNTMTTVSSVFGVANSTIFRKMNEKISGSLTPKKEDEDPSAKDVQDAYNNAVTVIQKYLNPKILENELGYTIPQKPTE